MKRAVEIGAGDRYSSQLLNAEGFDAIDVYEPNPILLEDLMQADVIDVDHRVIAMRAVGPRSDRMPLICLGYASYLVGYPSFFVTSIEPEGASFLTPLTYEVDVISAPEAVPEDTHTLVLTANGAEFSILQYMLTRPQVIRTKLYCHNAAHMHEANRITSWFAANRYDVYTLETNQHRTYYHLEARLR